MRSLFVCATLALVLMLCGCSDSSDGGTDYGPLLVQVSIWKEPVLGITQILAYVEHLGTPVDTATVQVNGVNVNSTGSGGIYQNLLGPAINALDDVVVAASYDVYSVSETLTMPAKPTITAPLTAGGPYDPAVDMEVTWNAVAPVPYQMTLVVYAADTDAGTDWSLTRPATAASGTIPGGTLAAGDADIRVTVYSANYDAYLGSHSAAGSWILVGNHSRTESLQTQ